MLISMDRSEVLAWLTDYEQAWRTEGVDSLADLFTGDAVYRQGPFEPKVRGLPAIAVMWEAERTGPDEAFTMTSEIVAVDGDVAVVRVEVRYGEPVEQEWRDLWIIRFAEDGRAVSFEEWPFAPDDQDD